MERTFLYQEWLQRRLLEYVQSPRRPLLHGRELAMSPQHYGAALMQAYLGKATLDWIAEQTGILVQGFRRWRQELEFLLVMDWSKPIFAGAMEGNLILIDYELAQYHDMAAEISLLEESLRVALRVPLYRRFKKLAQSLISRYQNAIALDSYDLRLFRRLFLFFLALEYHWPTPAGRRIHEDYLPLARDVVWPLLDQQSWLEPALSSVQQNSPLSDIILVLAGRLKETFQSLADSRTRVNESKSVLI
jgi:hypothetical protein